MLNRLRKKEEDNSLEEYRQYIKKMSVLGIKTYFEFDVRGQRVYIRKYRDERGRKEAVIPGFVYGIDDSAFSDIEHVSKIRTQGVMRGWIEEAFRGAEAEKLDLTEFDVSEVRDFSGVFAVCRIGELDIRGWKMRNAKSAACMFQYSEIDKLRIDGIDMNGVQDISEMFDGAEIGETDTSNIKVGRAKDARYMFRNSEFKRCSIDVRGICIDKAITKNMFRDTKGEIIMGERQEKRIKK